MKKTLLFVSCILSALFAEGQPGTLDSSFGVNGIVVVKGAFIAFGIAIQPDNKVIAIGAGNGGTFSAVRCNPNGTLDNTFGVDGIVNTPIPYYLFSAVATSINIETNGKILLAGYGGAGRDLFVMAQLLANGSMDSSFGDNGYVLTTLPGNCNAAVRQSDGKIILEGAVYNLVVSRYNSNGSTDSSFNDSGKIDYLNITSAPSSILVQSSGKIITFGFDPSRYFKVLRLNPNGYFDSTFGINGMTQAGLPADLVGVFASGFQTDGKIVLGGVSTASLIPTGNFGLVRCTTDGILDSSFGVNGLATIPLPNAAGVPNAVVFQSNGKIVLGGRANYLGNDIFALARSNSNGSIDSTFGSNGTVLTTIGSLGDEIQGIALQANGDIVVAGYTTEAGSYNKYFVIARYKGDPTTEVNNIVKSIISEPLISPNPATGVLYVSFAKPSHPYANYAIVNAVGQTCMTGSIRQGVCETVIDITKLNPGVYYFVLPHNNIIFKKQFSKF